jgi:hypothetical protein
MEADHPNEQHDPRKPLVEAVRSMTSVHHATDLLTSSERVNLAGPAIPTD